MNLGGFNNISRGQRISEGKFSSIPEHVFILANRSKNSFPEHLFIVANRAKNNLQKFQGSYKQDCVKFKDFSRTSKKLSYCFQGLKTTEKY